MKTRPILLVIALMLVFVLIVSACQPETVEVTRVPQGISIETSSLCLESAKTYKLHDDGAAVEVYYTIPPKGCGSYTGLQNAPATYCLVFVSTGTQQCWELAANTGS